MSGKHLRPHKTIELKAGPRPVLRTEAAQPGEPADRTGAGGSAPPAKSRRSDRSAQKDLILRLVEAVKAL